MTDGDTVQSSSNRSSDPSDAQKTKRLQNQYKQQKTLDQLPPCVRYVCEGKISVQTNNIKP